MSVIPRNAKPQIRRASGWAALAKKHLKEHSRCEACGAKAGLIVHHKEPVQAAPERELDPTNLMTLCEGTTLNCHLWAGHLGHWRSWNTTAMDDAGKFLKRVKTRPYK